MTKILPITACEMIGNEAKFLSTYENNAREARIGRAILEDTCVGSLMKRCPRGEDVRKRGGRKGWRVNDATQAVITRK